MMTWGALQAASEEEETASEETDDEAGAYVWAARAA